MHRLTQHRHIPLNTKGRDYVVGDLDGDWARLLERLDDRGFDCDNDRVFCTGNLIGPGEDAEGALMQLGYPWFYSVLGAAELEFARDGASEWLTGIKPWRKDELLTLVREHMPLAMTIDVPWGRVGLIHSRAPADWYFLASCLSDDEVWEECVSANPATGYVSGVDAVVRGHTAHDQVMLSCNQYSIKIHNPELAVLCIDELIACRAVG